MSDKVLMTKSQFDVAFDWANREAWDGSFGHRDHCRAIPQTVRGFANSTGPCNCDRPGIPLAESVGDCLEVHYASHAKEKIEDDVNGWNRRAPIVKEGVE